MLKVLLQLYGLLGFLLFLASRDVVRGGHNEPVALRTSLGWVSCGPTVGHGQDCTVSMSVQLCADQQLDDTLQKSLVELGVHWYYTC